MVVENRSIYALIRTIAFSEALKAILPECVDPNMGFRFLPLNPHKSFTNRFSGVRIILTKCFQNRLYFNKPDFCPVSALFPVDFLCKTSDFPFWNLVF